MEEWLALFGVYVNADSGRLVSSQPGRQLAVLHPRLLAVYQLARRQGTGAQGDSCVLSLAYQHSLARSAHSLLAGPFGGLRGRDFLAVTSLDGSLSVWEQESHGTESSLVSALLF